MRACLYGWICPSICGMILSMGTFAVCSFSSGVSFRCAVFFFLLWIVPRPGSVFCHESSKRHVCVLRLCPY